MMGAAADTATAVGPYVTGVIAALLALAGVRRQARSTEEVARVDVEQLAYGRAASHNDRMVTDLRAEVDYLRSELGAERERSAQLRSDFDALDGRFRIIADELRKALDELTDLRDRAGIEHTDH